MYSISAAVLMVIWEALELGLDGQLDSGTCAAIVFIPVALYIVICFKGSSGKIFTHMTVIFLIKKF